VKRRVWEGQATQACNFHLPFQSVYLDSGTANKFKLEVLTLVRFVHVMPYVLMGVGGFLLLLGFALAVEKVSLR